ncbi:MAG: Asp-tRNA(Asn)/Glu-tRNA(Gln) amidotransferase subunit GatA [Candidatus Pacebacteria bacterium]|nr:Asp-tRNA(Asn)/Glu-tRNA(Gln) amidotransferase subunit GatA [Candidatus Paceibacterota bacterium]
MIDTKNLTIKQAHESLMKGEYSAAELVAAHVAVIDEKNPELNAVLEVFADWKEQAAEADKMIADAKAAGKEFPVLTGIPIILKDNILFEGHIASAASKMLEHYKATYSCLAVKNLRAMGAVILGRANMDEFAMGSSTENSAYGVVKNPYDTSRVAGGSSGGSAVAVATGMCVAALGSDTAGSVRQPAAFCGIVGMKPSYDYATRHGVIAMGNSLDQVGPFTKTVEDAQIMCEAISAYDPNDARSVPLEFRKKYAEDHATIKPTIGIPWSDVDREGMDPEALANFKSSIEKIKAAGYEVKDISLPTMKYSLAAYYILMPAELSTNLSRFDGIRYGHSAEGNTLYDVYAKSRAEGFGPETRRRIMLGSYVLSHGYYDAYYRKAIFVRDEIKREMEAMFNEVDIIITPTSPTPAFKIGEKSHDPLAMYLSDIFTVPANLSGNPAISIPNGNHSNGLPLDIHFTAALGAEKVLFDFSSAYEKIRG